MIEYQSRVIDHDGKLSLLILSIHNNDRAAIRAATKLCRPNETLSVWRDDLCIYDEAPKAGLWFVWPIILANRSDYRSRAAPSPRAVEHSPARQCTGR